MATSCVLLIHVVPNAPRTAVVGLHGDALKVRLHAPPVDGKANAILVEFLAKTLGLPRAAVEILSGHTSRQKRLRLTGLSGTDALTALLASKQKG